MSGDLSPNTESSSLLWQVIGQWKLWVVAAVSIGLAYVMVTQTEETFFHEAWFVLIAVGSVLYALRRIEGLSVLG